MNTHIIIASTYFNSTIKIVNEGFYSFVLIAVWINSHSELALPAASLRNRDSFGIQMIGSVAFY